MRWFLAGCCGLALIHLSVSLHVFQQPRFYGVMACRKQLVIYCKSSRQNRPATVQWYKAATHEAPKHKVPEDTGTYVFSGKHESKYFYLAVKNVSMEQSGVYYCRVNLTWGPGTHVKIVKPVDLDNALYRSNVKDGLIILKALVLGACVAAVMLRRRTLMEKQDIIYEEPETDHIYEGLAIESCGGGLYEELSVYAQADDTEAPWE